MADYLIAAGAVYAVNLLPAFGPPTWSVLVLLTFNLDLSPWILVPLGALAAACGRLTLAWAARMLRGRVSLERRQGLDAARELLVANPRRRYAGLGLFALSPVPSAQLFVAAGLLAVPLLPLTAAFFSGRLISYSIYVGAATAAEESLGTIVTDSLTSPLGLALQVLMLAGLCVLWRVDWTRILAGHSPDPGEKPG